MLTAATNLVSSDGDLTNASYNKNTATVSGTEGSRGINTATVVVDPARCDRQLYCRHRSVHRLW